MFERKEDMLAKEKESVQKYFEASKFDQLLEVERENFYLTSTEFTKQKSYDMNKFGMFTQENLENGLRIDFIQKKLVKVSFYKIISMSMC